MRWQRTIPALVAAAILMAAVIGAFRYLPIRHAQPNRILRLAPTVAPPGFPSKPASTSSPGASSSPLASVKGAAKRAPKSTGLYVLHWGGSSAAADFASVLVYLLPSRSDAGAVQTEAAQRYAVAQSYKSNSYSLQTHFTARGVPEADGAIYNSTSTKVKQHLAVFVQQVDKVVVTTLIAQTAPTSALQANAVSFAQAEYQHLLPIASGFSLVRTHWPAVATTIYSAVALLLAGGAVTGPRLVGRVRHNRRRAQLEMARRQVMGRGGKIAKRQASHRR